MAFLTLYFKFQNPTLSSLEKKGIDDNLFLIAIRLTGTKFKINKKGTQA